MTRLALATTTALSLALSPGFATAQERTEFRVAWSIYVGWMPWGYLEESGIMDAWAERYGIDVEIVQINDYVESINLYTAGEFDGVSVTNMDTLSIPSGSGVDTTALIVGDFSNGNDAVILKGEGGLADLAGMPVNLVELSVSHYLLARALESVGLEERDLAGVINTSDADMIAAFQTDDVQAVVTWNPLVSTIAEDPAANILFTSADIPGEIIDMMVVNTEVLEANPDFGRALVGAWYELMAIMSSDTPEGVAARTAMAEASGTDLAGYDAQLASTQMFWDAADAVAFVESAELPETMVSVAEFLFERGILGEGAPSADFVGIEYPGGVVTGDPANIQLRFDPTYMQMAADGAL
ncbi:putative urea ABC transporter substrate-binding protein [Roseicyclus marinus]|uniref:putative urea ABC transporter substrate-binding protein n=1 Tax=Roseicyclus marinus TaxID=2161673 RepID=UPI0024100C2C|nr:putative urea ABC transporter substrate-binding protein [Roseicyclus marinus]MDG3041004.1 putative urea ABC transporter substrate-binding protein [Roseicyclus marinus]